MKKILGILALALGGVVGAQTASDRVGGQAPLGGEMSETTRRGWHFYEDPEKAESEARQEPKVKPFKAQPEARPELRRLKELQKELEELRTVAIMTPTERNVRRYMELESRVVENASVFADVAQRIAWATPELDPTTRGRPVNANALEIFESTQMKQRSEAVAELGKDHVLFFFFRSDCPYCHAYAPVLRAFEEKHRLLVVPISLDGGVIPGFSQPRRDNGIARTLNVHQVPAVFLAHPSSGRIMPIGFGVLSESQLVERIADANKKIPIAGVGGAKETGSLR